MAEDITRKMLRAIREGVDKTRNANSKVNPLIVEDKNYEEDNFLTRSKILMEEAENEKKKLNEDDEHKNDEGFAIKKNTPQFGDIRVSQEDALIKTIGEQVKLDDDALMYYPSLDDLVLNGNIPSMNTNFQFRFNDPSSEGIYIWSEALQLTDANNKLLGKLRDAFLNWKQSLVTDGDLFDKLKKVAERNS